jgi:hypothetical protein
LSASSSGACTAEDCDACSRTCIIHFGQDNYCCDGADAGFFDCCCFAEPSPCSDSSSCLVNTC